MKLKDFDIFNHVCVDESFGGISVELYTVDSECMYNNNCILEINIDSNVSAIDALSKFINNSDLSEKEVYTYNVEVRELMFRNLKRYDIEILIGDSAG